MTPYVLAKQILISKTCHQQLISLISKRASKTTQIICLKCIATRIEFYNWSKDIHAIPLHQTCSCFTPCVLLAITMGFVLTLNLVTSVVFYLTKHRFWQSQPIFITQTFLHGIKLFYSNQYSKSNTFIWNNDIFCKTVSYYGDYKSKKKHLSINTSFKTQFHSKTPLELNPMSFFLVDTIAT